MIVLNHSYINTRIQHNFTEKEQIKFSSLHPFKSFSVYEREVRLEGVNSCYILFDPETNFGMNPSAFLQIFVNGDKIYTFNIYDSNPVYIPSSIFKYKFNANNCKEVGWGFSFTVYPGDGYVNPKESDIFENPLNKHYESMMELISTSESKEIEEFKRSSSNLRIMSLINKFMLPDTLNQLYLLLKAGIELNLNTEILNLKPIIKNKISDAFRRCKEKVYTDNDIRGKEIDFKTVEVGYCIENKQLKFLPIERKENIVLIEKLTEGKESLYDYFDILRSINTMSSVKVLSTLYYNVNGILTIIENKYNSDSINKTITMKTSVDVFIYNSPQNVKTSKSVISIKLDGRPIHIDMKKSCKIGSCFKLEIIVSGIEYEDKKCSIRSLIYCETTLNNLDIKMDESKEIESFQSSLKNWTNQDYIDIIDYMKDLPISPSDYHNLLECLSTNRNFGQTRVDKIYILNKPLKEILTVVYKMVYMTLFTQKFKQYINNNNSFLQKKYIQSSYLIPLKYKNEWFNEYITMIGNSHAGGFFYFDRKLSENSKLRKSTNIFDSKLLLIQLFNQLMNDSIIWKSKSQRPFTVKYVNVEDRAGIDAGGLIRDFLDEIATEIFHPSISIFILTKNSQDSNIIR